MNKITNFFAMAFAIFALLSVTGAAEEAVSLKKNETSFYRDLFDQNFYYEGTNYLHLERLYQRLRGRKVRAVDVNVFDEVPDSYFFTNRHSRNPLSSSELELGYHENEGPDLSGDLTVLEGNFENVQPRFLIKDARGDKYWLKFDPADALELVTSAEIVASRFYHAIGYNVMQYTIITFPSSKLVSDADAKVYDDSGFQKKLTAERLQQYLLFLAQTPEGDYRASAGKVLGGVDKGNFNLNGRRKKDPNDPVNHKDRREIRALRIFASWLNDYDKRDGITQDVVITENGHEVLKHYLTDFDAALGSGVDEPKRPMLTHEYLIDYGETTKAFFGLGLWEKPWQKRWREVDERIPNSTAVGYFDNRYFKPDKFKTELPYFAFKDVTRADGFWAAKIIMSFSDDDIRSLVKAGRYTDPKDAETIANLLIERRNLIGRYWFEKANPLDRFDFTGNRLTFKDLAVEHGFKSAGENTYQIDVFGKKGNKRKKITSFQSQETAIAVDPGWLSQNDNVDLFIRTLRGHSKPSPYVFIELNSQGIGEIVHED